MYIHAERRIPHRRSRGTDPCDQQAQVPGVSSACCLQQQDLPGRHHTHMRAHTHARVHADPWACSQGPTATRGGEKFPRPTAKQLPVGTCLIAAKAKDPSAVSDSGQLVGWVPSGALAAC